ncbi:MAG: sugar ABC transporter substrate-binding protein [Actinobacteria bacterium]|nr:sugar ABC transporter substrate-binding protein [Actinomycetota bacterium]
MNKPLVRRRPKVVLAVSVLTLAVAVTATVSPAGASPAALDRTPWYAKGEPAQTDSTGARGAYDRAQGIAAAKKAGPKVKLPKLKAGFIQIIGAVYSAQRIERATKTAVQKIGWSWARCDAQGDPAKMESCGQSLLNQGVNVLFADGIEPSFINGTLIRARDKQVPVFIIGGMVTPSKLIYNYAPDEGVAAKILSAAVIKQLQALPGTKEVAVWNYPAIWGSLRTKVFNAEVQKTSDIKVKYTTDVDGMNVVDGTRTGVASQLTQTPDLKGIWNSFDSAAFGAAQAVKAAFPGKAFPDAPCVWTFSGDPPQFDAMRKGEVCILLDQAYDNTGWISVDQAAEWFARKKVPSRRLDGGYGRSVSFHEQTIVTKANVPKPGEWLQSPTSAKTFFTAKWAEEFTQ